MNTIELRDEKIYPDNSILSSVLGKAYTVYVDMLDLFERNGMNYEWRYYQDGKA